MQVVASQPSSVIEVSIEPGDELVTSIKRAIAESGIVDAFVMGSGEIEDAEVLTLASATGKREGRKLAGPTDLVSMSGTIGESGLELRAIIAHDSEAVGGLLIRGTVVSVQCRVLVRAPTATAAREPTRAAVSPPQAPPPPPAAPPAPPPAPPTPVASPVVVPAPSASVIASEPAVERAPLITPPPPPRSEPSSPVVPSAPMNVDPPRAASLPARPLPPKLKRAETIEVYPEVGDVVTHFAFGRCDVVFSDGERLRLQQERDSRVREVAMSMLRINDPTILEDGRRHWELARKN